MALQPSQACLTLPSQISLKSQGSTFKTPILANLANLCSPRDLLKVKPRGGLDQKW